MLTPLAFLFFVGFTAANLPPDLKACKRSAGDYKECLKTQIEKAFVLFKNGYEPFGLPPFEPLAANSLEIHVKFQENVLNAQYFDTMFYGLSNNKLQDISVDWKNINLTMFNPIFVMNGTYNMSGDIQGTHLQGNGPFQTTFHDNTVFIEWDLSLVEKNGKKYFHADRVVAKIHPKKLIFEYRNLFNGNKEMEQSMNNYLSENWKTALGDLSPAITETMGSFLKDYVDKIFNHVPADQLNLD